MFMSDYNRMIRENFDLSDKNTRRYIATLEDAGQEQLLNALSSALYDKIVTKVDDIDFSTIPTSRGDITKVEGFAGTEECLNIVRRLVVEYKQNPSIVDVVLSSIQNIKDRKALFIKAYTLNVELPIVMYNLIVLAIERSTSLMIATSIQYIKDPTSSSPKAALDKVAYQKTMDDMLFKQLISFNNMCSNKSFDKVLEAAMKNPVKEEVEFQYGTMTPIAEEDPDVNADNAIENPVDGSALTPDNTIDPFGSESDEAPVAEPEEPEMTGDTEIPAENEFPEDVPQDECDGPNCPTLDVPATSVEEEPEDVPVAEEIPDNMEPEDYTEEDEVETVPEEAEDDGVESDNIPPVVPGEDISPDDRPISEDESTVEESVLGTGAAIVAGTVIAPQVIGAVARGIGWLVSSLFIPMIRSLVYTHYNTKLKFKNYLEVQADLLEANANELKYSTTSELSDEERKKVVKKQLKTVEKLRKWANKFSIDAKSSQAKAESEIKKDQSNKKLIKRNDEGDDIIW